MIKIMTDSTVQLTKEEKQAYGITIIPLHVIADKKEYLDGEDLTKKEFLDLMNSSKRLPTTSQPSVGAYKQLFDELGKNGDEILSIHVSGDLSGTYSAAVQAAALTSSKVTVFDSGFVDRPMSYQVLTAAEMAKNGASIKNILQRLEQLKKRSNFYVAILHLDNLIKGGRINYALGKVSTFLNIKVVLKWTVKGLDVDTKGRGLKTISKKLEQVLQEMKSAGPLKEIGITQVGESLLYETWVTKIKQEFPGIPVTIGQASSALAVHAGREAFAISYLPESFQDK